MLKFATTKEQRDYFRRHHYVEFEGLLSEEQCSVLNHSIDTVLCKRLRIKENTLHTLSVDALFLHGRDLWRDDPKQKKTALHRGLAQAAVDLIEQKQLRIGYTQLFLSPTRNNFPTPPSSNVYTDFLEQKTQLQKISCIQGVSCGLMLCLKSPLSETATSNVFPLILGNGIFFDTHMLLDFTFLNEATDSRYMLIVYTGYTSVYLHQEGDPLVNYFRTLGYNFGDRLTEQLNPLVST